MDLNNLNPDELEALRYLLNKASGGNPTGQPGVPPPVSPDRPWGGAPPPNPPTVTRVMPAEAWVAKQIGNLQAVGETNYRAGITMPKKDPIKAGIAAQPKYESAMRDPKVLARRKESLEKTNMDEWASMAERVGAPALVRGVTERQYKIERFVGSYVSKLAEHLRTIDALPDVTDADRERRMIENRKGLKALKGKMK